MNFKRIVMNMRTLCFALFCYNTLAAESKPPMRRFSHYGIPTKEVKENEAYVEVGGFKFYTTPYEANKYHIQWHRFEEGHGLPELLTQVPHVAFEVDNLDEEIKDKKIILGPYYPFEGFRVAIIDEQGIPIEFIETKLSDTEITEQEQKKFIRPNE